MKHHADWGEECDKMLPKYVVKCFMIGTSSYKSHTNAAATKRCQTQQFYLHCVSNDRICYMVYVHHVTNLAKTKIKWWHWWYQWGGGKRGWGEGRWG